LDNPKLSDDKHIQRQPQYQYCAVNKLIYFFVMLKHSKKCAFLFLCTSMYASQLV